MEPAPACYPSILGLKAPRRQISINLVPKGSCPGQLLVTAEQGRTCDSAAMPCGPQTKGLFHGLRATNMTPVATLSLPSAIVISLESGTTQ